ncbi:MAG TPA: cupin domain-containing protein [Stellaceae bacterium]|nr:cupin domain-containing protein [Stellaceae bacterium]
MAEIERTRERERERPTLNAYEVALQDDKARGERMMTGRIVVKMADCPQMLSRQGRLRYYLSRTVKDTPLQDWSVFTHEVRTMSGKHRHQGGLVIYVIDGKGYSVVDGERIDWEKGDLLLLPLRPNGVEHQHFNSDPNKYALWMAFINGTMREYLASEMTQTEVSPEYLAQEAKAGR